MKSFSAIVLSAFFAVAALAQEAQPWEVQSLSQIIPGTVEGKVDYDSATGTATGTNGVYVNYNHGSAVLTADTASGKVSCAGGGAAVLCDPATARRKNAFSARIKLARPRSTRQ